VSVAIAFDLFGTLVDAERPADPAGAVAAELRERDVRVPDDWQTAYTEPHIDAPEGAEVPLPAHVSSALASRGVDAPNNASRRAVVAAFDPIVESKPAATAAIEAAAEYGPVGLLSNCSVPELVGRTLIRSSCSREEFDAVVSSVGCGWRKPHRKAFETVADRLSVSVEQLIYIGDTPATDGGIVDCGGTFIDITECSLSELPARLKTEVSERSNDT